MAAELFAFTADQVCRLTGLSKNQLRYWDETGFFAPTVAHVGGRPFGRVYSFRDVVGLRTLSVLRNEKKVSLQYLRTVGERLKARAVHAEPWSGLRFYLAGKKVVIVDPASGTPLEQTDEQGVLATTAEEIVGDVRTRLEQMRARRREQLGKVEKDRYVLRNEAVIAGTRIPTRSVWNLHKAGYSAAKIREEFPRLTEKDVRGAIAHERRASKARAA